MKVWKQDLEPRQGLSVEQLEAWDDLVAHTKGWVDRWSNAHKAQAERKLIAVRRLILEPLAARQAADEGYDPDAGII